MAETANYPMEHQLGCGLMGGIFPRRSFWRRKTPVYSLPTIEKESSSNNVILKEKPPISKTKSDSSFLETSNLSKKPNRKSIDIARSSTSSTGSSQVKLRKALSSESKDLGMIITNTCQQSKDSKALVRANSSNLMLIHKNIQETNSNTTTPRARNSFGNGVMGNIVRQSSGEFRQCQSPSKIKMDPEILKNVGNEKYKKGRYEEALGYYDRAISLDSSKAIYRSNKSAALIGLGRLTDAVVECKEAIRLDPSYQRAHHRLAELYVRLGEAEKALYHYKQSGSCADSQDIAQVQAFQKHLNKCIEARKLKEWNVLVKETDCAISSGADSSPKVYAMQAEALLRLHRHEEAYRAYRRGPNFSIDSCTKCFGLATTSHLLMIGAQVYMGAGRFDDATEVAQQAARLDPSSREANTVVKVARAVASARLSGNLLYNASKFSEACVAYSEGLDHEPYNSILLCNRAACRSKLHQFEKAVEDCTAALTLQPNYSKARLRRAHCNAKLERWEASIQDYEMLIRESPADEEIGRALFEAKIQLKKQRGEDIKDLKFGSNLVFISSNETFRYLVTSPGMSVVLFCNKENHKQVLQLMEQVCKRFPSVNFLKVEVEDHPYLAKSENVISLPSFKIYKNGSRVKEIPGNNCELLEKSVKLYSS
ncbi:hypothetical protein JCGZ_15772 [Jatropha curcas]|uniref:Thioredoxin domain-containing protein n=1 Tax=Jatropha curcas TaxID=180498 RepID=A0A067LA33_JATCU|nr:TPR repeat-containing thioredoxin TTL1 [Jatropha curcas]KDP41365.1 hypothetical protein JCGZ_15772 [Jatropha curcas]